MPPSSRAPGKLPDQSQSPGTCPTLLSLTRDCNQQRNAKALNWQWGRFLAVVDDGVQVQPRGLGGPSSDTVG